MVGAGEKKRSFLWIEFIHAHQIAISLLILTAYPTAVTFNRLAIAHAHANKPKIIQPIQKAQCAEIPCELMKLMRIDADLNVVRIARGVKKKYNNIEAKSRVYVILKGLNNVQ